MKKIIKELLCLVAALVGGAITMHATTDSVTFNYSAGVTLNTGGEQFAPYYIASGELVPKCGLATPRALTIAATMWLHCSGMRTPSIRHVHGFSNSMPWVNIEACS